MLTIDKTTTLIKPAKTGKIAGSSENDRFFGLSDQNVSNAMFPLLS